MARDPRHIDGVLAPDLDMGTLKRCHGEAFLGPHPCWVESDVRWHTRPSTGKIKRWAWVHGHQIVGLDLLCTGLALRPEESRGPFSH